MKNKQHDIDRFFRNKLLNHEHKYLPEYWTKMEGLLSKIPTSGISSFGTKILGLSKLKFISLLIAIPSIITIAYYFTVNQTENTIKQSINEVQNNEQLLASTTDSAFDNSLKINNNQAEVTNNILSKNDDNLIHQNRKVIDPKPEIPNLNIEGNKKAIREKNETDIQPNNINKNSVSESKNDKKLNEISGEKLKPIENNAVLQSEDKTILTDSNTNNYKGITDTKQKTIPSEKNNETEKIDTAKNEQIVNNTTNQDLAENARFSFITGGTLINNFTNQSPHQTKFSLSPSIGIAYQFPVFEKYELSFSGNYLRSTGNSLDRYSVRTHYFLFKEVDSIYLSTKSIDFINFNIDLQRKFNDKHYFSGGIFIASRLNTKSIRNQVIESPFYYFSKTTEEKGYWEGISSLSYGLSLDYKYKLLKNGYVGLRINQSFNDLIDNKVYLNKRKDFMTQFQLYLKWMLR